jgi:hypothetical protein
LKRLDAPTKAPAWPVGSEGESIWPAPTEGIVSRKARTTYNLEWRGICL